MAQLLGLELKFCEPEHPWAGWKQPGHDRPLLLAGRPFEGEHVPGNGAMTALLAADRATVDACHAYAMAAGCADEGAPGLRPQYHAAYYGAYFRDLDSNKLCVCCHQE